jgi:hypothetical protein
MTRQAVHAGDTSSLCRQRYLANLASLYRRDPDLAAQLDARPFGQAPALEPARDGHLTVRLPADDGREIYAHSRVSPLDETGKFVAGLPATENPTFFISGLGLGYHLPEFERRFDRPTLLVAEDDLGLIKTALGLHDLSAAISDGRLIFLTSANKNALHARLSAVSADLLLGVQFVALPHARRYHAPFHEEMRRLLTDFVAFTRMQVVTLLRNARITFKNVAFNLPSYLSNPGIETLHNRAAGYPAIIVAAGPSLARNLDQLGPLRERAVLIAVQTVFKLLLSLKLRPHFVTSLDFHEVSAEFFRGVDDGGDCILVAEPKATWHVLDMWNRFETGRTRVLHHGFYDTLLQEHAPQRGGLPAGATVAHLAFYLAQHLGCDPIIFVGQDLAFSEGMFYMPGSPIESVWQPELNRFQTVEMKQWERIVRNRKILRSVQDMHGRQTYADELLFTYAEQFKKDFAAAPQRIIQATEGGVFLPGTEVMPLRDAARRYCTRPLPVQLFTEGEAVPAGELARASVPALEQRIEELHRLRGIAREMSGLLERLEGLVEKPAEFNRLIVRVDELRTLIHNYDQMYRLVVEVSAMAELRRHTADRRLGVSRTETPATARQRLKRDRDFVEGFIDGCEFLAQVLPEALARLREQKS